MFTRLTPVFKGILLALTGYTAFAIADICAKWLSAYYSITQIIACENLVAVGLLLGFALAMGRGKGLVQGQNWKIHVLRTALNFATVIMLTWCYKHFPIANVYTMIFTKPFFAALIVMCFFSERPTRAQIIAIVIGFAGVVIAMRPGSSNFEPLMFMPLVCAAVIAMLFISARFIKNPDFFGIGLWPMLGTALLALPFMMMDFHMPAIAHLPVFLLIGVTAGTGIVCVSLAFRIAPASAVSPFLYIEMIWALVFGWLLFHDAPDIWMLAGAAIIIASGIYLVETERRGNSLLPGK